MPRRLPDVLDTRIGRRLVLLFIATGILPLALFAWPIQREARAGLSEEVLHGLLGYARLATAQIGGTLTHARMSLRGAERLGERNFPELLRRVAEIEFSPDDRRRILAGEKVAVMRRTGPGVTTVVLLEPGRDGKILAAEIDPISLWISTRPRNLRASDLLLVVDGEGRILASSIDPRGTSLAGGRLPFPVPLSEEESGEAWIEGVGEIAWGFAEVESAETLVGTRWGVVVARRTDAAGGVPERLFRSLLLFSAFSLAVLILLSMRIARGIHRPIADLLEATKEVAAGDWSARAEVTRRDEIGTLAQSFNEMTAALQRDVRTQLRLEEEAMVGRLASTVAHEVNNPLASIKNRLGLLARRIPPELRPEIAPLEGQINRIARTIRSLLDYSDRRSLRTEDVDLDVLATETASLLAPSYRAKGIDLRILPPAAPLWARGDAVAIQEVLLHLLEFERERLESGRTVRITIREGTEGMAEILFADDGPGLGEDPERIFHPSPRASSDGTGLGLAVARRLAEAQNGFLRLSDGARFLVLLPRSSPPSGRDFVVLSGGSR